MIKKIIRNVLSSSPLAIFRDIKNSKINLNFNFFNVKSKKELDSILSVPKLKKEDLIQEDKLKFIGNLEPHKIHINRSYGGQPSDKIPISWFHHSEESFQNLSAITKEEGNDKVIILGSAGLGKTYELEHLALEIWDDKSDPRIPIYSNFKNFTSQNLIEGFIYKKWNAVDNAIFIFDGIDEIQDIQDFISKLQNFITTLEKEDANFSVVISCRTNTYESIVKHIFGFEVLYLKELVYLQGRALLKHWSGSIIDELNFDADILNFLRNPFQIKILSDYINTHSKLPANSAILWSSYIDKRLSQDKKDKFKKSDFNTPLIKSYSKKISLINELSGSNFFNEDQLYKIVNGNSADAKDFKMNPLIDKIVDSENWYFEHRNIQEYFAALTISELDFDDIIGIIQIENTRKTNPSLFNTISFLINILDKNSSKYENVIQWFLDNEPELLFKAEGDRISPDIREKVFQNYFEKECKEKTFWISTKRTFSIRGIAIFGSVPNNLTYLLEEIEDKENHHRVLISAIELLSCFIVPPNRIQEVKAFLFDCLTDPDYNISIKARIVNCITIHQWAVSDDQYLDAIFELFAEDTGNEINNALLSLIENYENPDKFFDFIHDEFLRVHNIQPRAYPDEVQRGNDSKVKDLIMTLESPDNFLEITKYFFNNQPSISLSNGGTFLENCVEKCVQFIEIDSSFINRFLYNIYNKTLYFTYRRFLIAIIKKSGTEEKAILYLINDFTSREILLFIASLINEDSFIAVKERIMELELPNDTVETFRNYISNNGNHKLAQRFDAEMRNEGIIFNTMLFSEEDRANQEIAYHQRIQDNFDILFEPDRLILEIEEIFAQNDITTLTADRLREITGEWYDQNGHGNQMEESLQVVHDTFYRNGIQEADQARQMLTSNEFFRIKRIEELIQRYEKDEKSYIVSEKQKKVISDWCEKTSKSIDFEDLIIWGRSRGFGLSPNFERLETVFFFMQHFDVDLEQSFLLDSIEVFNLKSTHSEDKNFEYLFKRINNKALFDSRIIHNLKNRRLTRFSLTRHIDYALENNLRDGYPEIRNYLTNLEEHVNESNRLQLYLKKSADISVLKDCCTNIHSSICWSAIEILVERKEEKAFCIRLAHEYLNSEKDIFISNALKVLFYWNESDAIRELLNVVDKGLLRVLSDNNFTSYNSVEDYHIIQELYEVFYLNPSEGLEGNFGRTFTQTYISNLSINDDGYKNVQMILLQIKRTLEADDDDLFYINLLIDESKRSHIISKSKSYKFNEAYKIVDKFYD